jgi:ATPase family AAA domain-containing protein 3A/B
VEARLGKPSLVRETSRRTLFGPLRHPLEYAKYAFTQPKDTLRGIIVNVRLKSNYSYYKFIVANLHKELNSNSYFHGKWVFNSRFIVANPSCTTE